MEEDRLKLEEELRRRQEEEEQKRLQEAAQREAEEKAKEAERAADLEAREKAWEEEKAQLEAENQKLREHRNSILEVPSPQGKRRQHLRDEDFAEGKTQAAADEDEFEVGDSASAVRPAIDNDLLQKQMDERIKALEEDMRKRQEAVMEQMKELEEKNKRLEAQVAVQDRNPSPSLSPLRMDQTPPKSPGTVTATFEAQAQRNMRNSIAGRDRRNSRLSAVSSNRRVSAAHQALMTTGNDPATAQQDCDGSPVVANQRRWWAEQRQFLLEDLFPESPGSTPGRTNRRASVGGSAANCIDAERNRRVSQPAQRLATHPEPEEEQENEGIPQANLQKRFEHAHNHQEGEGQAAQLRQENAQHPQKGRRDSTDSRMRQPKLYWNDRHGR